MLSSVVRTEKIGLLPSDSGKMIHRVLKDLEIIFFFTLGKADKVTSQPVTEHRKALTKSNSMKSSVAKKLEN